MQTRRRNRPSRYRPSETESRKELNFQMTKQKTNDALSRSDRVLVAAMAIILATASAAIGASP